MTKPISTRTDRATDLLLSRQQATDSLFQHETQQEFRETLLAGAAYRDAYTDLQWTRRQAKGNWAIRTLGFGLRKSFRKGCSSITFDQQSFEQARAAVPANSLVVLAPTHRSMMDFLVCSYLCFAHPELKISIPYIAADLQIGGLPLLGWFLKQAHAFYLKRGQGGPDPELNKTIRQLVQDQQTLEIFIEGTRSRSRQCMPPKRGLLRALQQTGVTSTLLPITISYDRLPEESALIRELKGGPKPLMQIKPLLKWMAELAKGEIQIGRVHLACGEPVLLDSESDVHAVSFAIMHQLQSKYVVTTFHLGAFLRHHPHTGYDLKSLTDLIRERGGTVLESPLDASQVDQLTERSYRNQWLHLFFPELLALYPDHPVILHYIQANSFAPLAQAIEPEPAHNERLMALLHSLFQPLSEAYQKVIEIAHQQSGLPYPCARTFVAQHPECFLPKVEAALNHLTEVEVLVKSADKKQYECGPEWHKQLEFYSVPLWDLAPALKT